MKKLSLKMKGIGEMLTREQMKKVLGGEEMEGGGQGTCRHYSQQGGYNIYTSCMTMAQASAIPGNYCCDSCSSMGFPPC